jgi:hypothetical protein
MDRKATRPTRPGEEAVRASVASSPHDKNTLEAQAQTQDSVQPLGHFHAGERTMSPPPDALEKARVPSPSPYPPPDTPSASTISGFSRSSTINSSKSRDSEITLYSQSSDETVSVPRSSSFPVMGFSPPHRDAVPNAAYLRLLRRMELVPGQHPTLPAPGHWARADLEGSHPAPLRDEEVSTPNNPILPSRHSTFPIGRSRNPMNLEDTPPSSRGDQGQTDPDLSESKIGYQLPNYAIAEVPEPEMRHDVAKQGLPSDGTSSHSLPVQTDIFLQGRFSAKGSWLVGSIDRKRANLHGLTESSLHYRRRLSRLKTDAGDVPLMNTFSDGERPCSQIGHTDSSAETVVNPESATGLGYTQNLEMAGSLSSCSSPRVKPLPKDYRLVYDNPSKYSKRH